MTFAASLSWSLIRALIVTLLAWPCCHVLRQWIERHRGTRRSARLALVVIPFIYPELLVGYAYAPWVAGLPAWSEAACAFLMGLRAIPVGVVALGLTPPSSISPSALHCRWLSIRNWRDRADWVRIYLQASLLPTVPMLSVVWLVTFQQFELAALLKSASWTDWLFVQQVGGLALTESLRVLVIPGVIQLICLVGIGWLTGAHRSLDLAGSQSASQTRWSIVPLAVVALSWLALIVIPTGYLGKGLPAGLAQLAAQPLHLRGITRELIGGLAVATIAALTAWMLCGWISNRLQPERLESAITRTCKRLALLCLLAPGLMGTLILSLVLIAGFQLPGTAWLYPTPLRWVLGLTLYLLPRAYLLRLWLSRRATSAEFLAARLAAADNREQRVSGRAISWRLVEQPRLIAVAALVSWGYLDLTTAYLLAPVGMSSGVVRLYNFMHFGRTLALSAEATVLLIGPFVLAAGLWLVWRGVRA